MSSISQADLEALARTVGALLQGNGQTLSTAESCTGGWVAQCLTAIPGSSQWFDRGFVTYSNAAKQEMLGVSTTTLETQGAVSETTAAEMALGALRHSQSDWSLAITGIAGPDGGNADKPVGTVFFAWAGTDGQLATAHCKLSGTREDIRAKSVVFALKGILERAEVMQA